MMASIGSLTTNDTPCELFSDTIMGQLQELECHICDILGAEAVAHVKANTNAVRTTRGKGINKIQLRKIWYGREELVIKAIDKNTQMCKYHAENNVSHLIIH